jgi:HSP20 family molecular chaperone IbpA
VEEINNTRFFRKVEIPSGYDINQASTTYKDGALTITFKKKVEKNVPRAHVITSRKRGVCVVQ